MSQTHFFLNFVLAVNLLVVGTMANDNLAERPLHHAEAPLAEAPAPRVRKLGHHHDHHHHKLINKNSIAPSQSPEPSQAPETMLGEKASVTASDHPSATETTSMGGTSNSSEVMHMKSVKHHHGVDKSVAGGAVIVVGLAASFVVAIGCYIRASRKSRQQVEASEV